jgi:glucose/mannose transport system substrate-binding protein
MNEKQIKLARYFLVIVIIASLFLIIAGGFTDNFSFVYQLGKDADSLVIYHWWTSPGETAALNSLVDVFTEKYPDVEVITPSVPGGGGYALLEVIKPLVNTRKAPDAFQMHAGYEAKPYFNAGLLAPVNNIWKSEGLEKVIPKVVQVMCQFDWDYYSVPVDIHRANVVWYNKKILDDADIDYDDLTTWNSFFNACDKLKITGIKYPIQMGADWTAAHVFETIMASEGIDFYEDWINGKIISEDDPRLLEAFETFKKYLSYVNPDNANLEWNNATARIISGEGAFNIMGDWANGEFKILGKVYDVDYGAFTVPETENMYGLVIDTFQHPKGIAHPLNSERWLKVVSSKEGQDAFNPLKGSISARVDIDVSKYDLYSKLAALDFASIKYMYPSVVHGSGAPELFKVKLKEIMSDFVKDLDVSKAAKIMTDYTKEISNEYSTEWQLN